MGRQRMIKKMKQAGRRQARLEIEALVKKFEEHLRPKPRWVPGALWRWGQRLFITLDDHE